MASCAPPDRAVPPGYRPDPPIPNGHFFWQSSFAKLALLSAKKMNALALDFVAALYSLCVLPYFKLTGGISHVEDCIDHRHHRSGRRLPGRISAGQGLHRSRDQAAHLAVQHRADRSSVPGPAGTGPEFRPASRRDDRFVEPDPDHPDSAARRDLQPRGAESCCRFRRGTRIHRQCRWARHAADT